MEKTKTVVNIGGKEYTLCSYEGAEFVHRVSIKVNEKIEEIRKANPDINNVQIFTLTAINMAEDWVKLSDELKEKNKEIEKLTKDLEQYKKMGASTIVKPFSGK